MNKKERLNKSSTKELLGYLKDVRKFGGCIDITYNNSRWSENYFTVEEIKEVLKDREHVPNKQEGKVIRQNKAKGRNGDKAILRDRR